MEIFYLVIIIALFLLAISDLVVGVSNDAVNFLNSAIGSKASNPKIIFGIAALGIIVGCTFSSGMMEVARKGIFHPEYFYFNELILLFLAVMVTDVILLDAFNSFGMPTSTTVSIVFELLGAAVALSLIKIFTSDDGLSMAQYINSDQALLIISGILLSVVIAFTAGALIQYLTRLLFSFAPQQRLRWWGAIWGGLAITAITYFMIVKGSKGASFMTDSIKAWISDRTGLILLMSFGFWAVVLQLLILFTRINILRIIVLVGTFSLAMAFAGNDLVNFIGVPLAGYNSYQIWIDSGAGDPSSLAMDALAGKVPTPTLLLMIAGLIMTITLIMSKKARSVVQTSLDLGRQDEGSERFESYAISRSMVRNVSRAADFVTGLIPTSVKKSIEKQFDETPFKKEQAKMGDDAPSFDLLRAAVTLVVASVLITLGTNLKLPLSTTYVTFMVFMGTSLADGAWGRESAVYRVSGVLSVIGGWFFTAFSAFTIAFIFANIFYWGGTIAIIAVLLLAVFIIYRSHRYHEDRLEEQVAFERGLIDETISKEESIERVVDYMENIFSGLNDNIQQAIIGLKNEDLQLLKKTKKSFDKLKKKTGKIEKKTNSAIGKIEGDETEAAHLMILVADYLNDIVRHADEIIPRALEHTDNNHKALLSAQIDELSTLQETLAHQLDLTAKLYTKQNENILLDASNKLSEFLDLSMHTRKSQIKRIKSKEIGTSNSLLVLNMLSGMRNIALTSGRMLRIYENLLGPTPEEEKGE